MAQRLHRLLLAGTAVLVGLILLRSRLVFPYPFELAPRLLVLAAKVTLVSAAFVGWGELAIRSLRRRSGLQVEAVSLAQAWALGAAMTATAMGFMAPFWYPNIFFAAPWLAAGALLLLRRWRILDLELGLRSPLSWILAPFAACSAFLALAPPLSLDSLVYHLALPKQFALQGQAFEMPWNLHSYFPQHAELLFGLTLELDATGILAQVLHLVAAFWTVVVVIRVGTREFDRRAGIFAAIILCSIPAYCVIAGWAWNDWFVLLYTALGLDRILSFRDSKARHDYLLAALFLGAAAAVKYNALPLLALLAVGFSGKARRLVPAAAIAVAVLCAPWYGTNLIEHANPVYPLLSETHGAGSLTDYRGETGAAERWLGYLGRRDIIDESIGLLWIACLPLGLGVLFGAARRLWPLGVVLGLYALAAVLFHPTVRAFGPLFLAASWLSGEGLARLTQRVQGFGEGWGRRAVILGCVVLLGINLSQAVWVLRHYDPVGVALGFDDRETYLATGHDYYDAYRWLDANSEATDVVMVVGESRIFYLDRPAIAGSYLDQPVLSGFLPDPSSATALERLRQIGVAYVFVNRAQYRVAPSRPTTTNEILFFSDPVTDAVLKELLARHGRVVYEQGPIQVYRLGG